MTNQYEEKMLNKLIDSQPKLKFEALDRELAKHDIPKDISKIIFGYYTPVCDDCDNCCSLCCFYCFYECLRQNNRNVCCNTEFNINSNRYNITKNIKMDIVSEEEDTEA